MLLVERSYGVCVCVCVCVCVLRIYSLDTLTSSSFVKDFRRLYHANSLLIPYVKMFMSIRC